MGNSKEGDLGDDMSDLGAIALISRFFKQLWTHRGLYLGILVLFVLPTVAVLQVFLLLTGLNPATKQEIIQKMAAGDFTDVEIDLGMIVQIAASFLVAGLLQVVFNTIQYIPIVYTAASLLTNKTVVIADAARAVGRLWKPAILTFLSFFALTYGLIAITVAIMYAFYLRSSLKLMMLVSLFDVAFNAFLSFAFQLGPVVPVLEGVYGWKALGRSWKLLQGKKWVAFRMITLMALLILVVAYLSNFFLQLVLRLLGISNVSTAGSVITFVLNNIVFVSVVNLLSIGIETFLYSSCRDLHRESITDSAFLQAHLMKGGYEKIAEQPENYDIESPNTHGS